MILTHANKSQEKIMATSKKESVFQMSRTLGNIRRYCVLAFGTYDSWWVRGWEVTVFQSGGRCPVGVTATLQGHLQQAGNPSSCLLEASRPSTGGRSQPPGPPQCCVYSFHPLLSHISTATTHWTQVLSLVDDQPRSLLQGCPGALYLLHTTFFSPSLKHREASPISWAP